MLKILHKGIQVSIPLNKTGFTGDIATDAALAVVTNLKAGRVAKNSAAGAVLVDGATDSMHGAGFLVNDAAGAFYENKPAFASEKVVISCGAQLVVTDQIDTTETFAIGDKLYVGTAAEVGLITKTSPGAGAEVIGVAQSAASAASPELTILRT